MSKEVGIIKRFKFSLQTPLNVAESEEKNIKSKLAVARAKLRGLEFELRRLKERLKITRGKLAEDMQEDITASELVNYHYHMFKLTRDIKAYEQMIREENEKCEMILRGLLAIKNKVKVFETLKEGKHACYLKEFERKEEKKLEDFINGRAVNT